MNDNFKTCENFGFQDAVKLIRHVEAGDEVYVRVTNNNEILAKTAIINYKTYNKCLSLKIIGEIDFIEFNENDIFQYKIVVKVNKKQSKIPERKGYGAPIPDNYI